MPAGTPAGLIRLGAAGASSRPKAITCVSHGIGSPRRTTTTRAISLVATIGVGA